MWLVGCGLRGENKVLGERRGLTVFGGEMGRAFSAQASRGVIHGASPHAGMERAFECAEKVCCGTLKAGPGAEAH